MWLWFGCLLAFRPLRDVVWVFTVCVWCFLVGSWCVWDLRVLRGLLGARLRAVARGGFWVVLAVPLLCCSVVFWFWWLCVFAFLPLISSLLWYGDTYFGEFIVAWV